MAHINANKSQAAKINSQQGGLHKQRRGGKSIKLQDQLVKLAAANQGYTVNQLAWIAAGFKVDENGYCQPAGLYQQVQDYFNGKRRGCEISFKATELKRHPRARLVYCKAKNNPYTEAGGYGVRPITEAGQASALSDQVTPNKVTYDIPEQTPKPAPVAQKPANKPVQQPKPANAAQHVASIQDMLK